MRFTASTNVWSWTGADTAILTPNDDDVLGAGVSEDRVVFGAKNFSGPALVSDLLGIGFSLFIADTQPLGAPDGTSGETSLSSLAPNTDNFSGTGDVINKVR